MASGKRYAVQFAPKSGAEATAETIKNERDQEGDIGLFVLERTVSSRVMRALKKYLRIQDWCKYQSDSKAGLSKRHTRYPTETECPSGGAEIAMEQAQYVVETLLWDFPVVVKSAYPVTSIADNPIAVKSTQPITTANTIRGSEPDLRDSLFDLPASLFDDQGAQQGEKRQARESKSAVPSKEVLSAVSIQY